MVLVEPPSTDPASDIAEPPVGSERTAPSPVESESASAVDSERVDDAAVAAQEDQRVEPDENVAPPPIPAAVDDESTQPDGSSYAAESDAQGEPILPTADWTSEASRRRQQLLLIGGAALIGIVLAFGVFAFIVSRAFRSPPDDPVSPSPAEPEVESIQPPADESSVASADSVDAGPADPIEQAPPVPVPVPIPIPMENSANGESTGPPADEPQIPAPPEEKQAPPDTPPAVGPGTGQDVKTEVAGEPDTTPEATLTSPELSEALDQFAPFIDPDDFVESPSEMEPTESEQPELDPAESEPDEVTVPRPEPRQVDVAERLNDAITAIEFKDRPLKDFIRFLMGFSTIPMTLDPDALALVGESPNSPVNVQQADTTVGQALSGALTPLRLGAVTVGEQIVVTRPAPPGGALRTYEHPVGDLVGDDPAALSQLAKLLVAMIEPNSWDELGGDGEMREAMPALDIRQRDTVLFRVIVLCERLRAARGLPPQSNFDRELEPRLARAATHLDTPVTLNHIEPASFIQILDHLSDTSSVDILVDWQAIAEIGWNPDAKTTIRANGEPIGDVLAKLLLPMGLTYRIVNETCVQVTSPKVLETRLEVEFYPCLDLLPGEGGADGFEKRLRQQLGEQKLDQVGASLHIDRPSGYLIAALPQPLHRRLAELLKQWRMPAP